MPLAMRGGNTIALTPNAVTSRPLRTLRKPGPSPRSARVPTAYPRPLFTCGYSFEASMCARYLVARRDCKRRLIIGDVAVRGRQRMTIAGPAHETPAHRIGVEARGAERLRGHQRARADAAVEHDRPLALHGRGLRAQ